MKQVDRFCRCIKAVKKTVKLRKGMRKHGESDDILKERAAIAICVKSVLQSRGRTLKKFKCRSKDKYLKSQKFN